MDRDTAVNLGVAVLAIVALGAAAATLDTAVVLGGGDGGSGFGSGTTEDQSGGGSGSGPLLPGEFTGEIEPVCFPVLREPLVLAGIGLTFAGGVSLVYLHVREPLSTAIVSAVAALPVGIVWFLLAFCGEPIDSLSNPSEAGIPVAAGTTNETRIPLLGGGGSGEASGTVLSAPSAVVFVLIGVALVGVATVLLAGRGDDAGGSNPRDRASKADPDVAAIAQTAGRTADRIAADVAVDNEVYRAWAAVTDALDLESPETTTPAAFERAAVEAGMEPDDVAELRRLFEEIRYGGKKPSEAYEQRAIAALRRVEDEYGALDANGAEQ